ncbi:MAG: bacteriohopanetetrol glucosamine biosynthesis glycosyltransferase HpnI, partial [Acidocella sp.]|nr:bacteriohopanetetrol glucosamine biosynthesis glycosyltransferase HpnI [Acidocella sp.]
VFSLIGIAQHYFGVLLLERFVVHKNSTLPNPPAVSVLKPLCGVEPLTEVALESFFLIDYPQFQLVFGVQDPADPVLHIIARLRARYPTRDVALVIDTREHGSNRKVSNLINMLPFAQYETLVMSDADIHVPPYFLDAVTCSLAEPGVGLVTTLYTALPGTPHLATSLGASQINFTFLPGALLARKLGRQDCLGVTMALKRHVLNEIGGLYAIANHLADDQVLGRLVRAKGYGLTLAPVIPSTTVHEANFKALFRHELRWARTIRALVPIPYAASVLQFSLVWALLGLALSGFPLWGWGLLITLLLWRFMLAKRIGVALGLAKAGEAWLCLVRDLLSLIIYIVSFFGDKVNWRGHIITADPGRPDIAAQCPSN